MVVACRVLPDRGNRPRVAYFAGFDVGNERPRWAFNLHRDDVLHGTRAEAMAWAEMLSRDGSRVHVCEEGR